MGCVEVSYCPPSYIVAEFLSRGVFVTKTLTECWYACCRTMMVIEIMLQLTVSIVCFLSLLKKKREIVPKISTVIVVFILIV